MKFIQGRAAGKKLIELGILPPNTITFDIVIDHESPVILKTESYLDSEQYKKMLSVFVEFAEPVEVS